MTLSELIALLAVAAGGWLVWTGLQAREAANVAMRAACKAEGLLFLDDTVGLQSMQPVRDDEGRMALRRVYGFEYSDDGDNRRKGSVALLGDRVIMVDVGLRAVPEDATLH